ncbi:hypothetical protein cyc_05052 [Cyclospora cayetanensis]|uniref:Uncharacterized protein n=1 Tax=Cyclospora cayetanensis TaxID=88456 RepID=A0A1D3D3S9_9EIME|nr:hypothetical protein cyc_05052 [Cyclospora cayetanensis]
MPVCSSAAAPCCTAKRAGVYRRGQPQRARRAATPEGRFPLVLTQFRGTLSSLLSTSRVPLIGDLVREAQRGAAGSKERRCEGGRRGVVVGV